LRASTKVRDERSSRTRCAIFAIESLTQVAARTTWQVRSRVRSAIAWLQAQHRRALARRGHFSTGK
jgi:hypothetical protein